MQGAVGQGDMLPMNRFCRLRSSRGVTLIEILVVIAIILILMAMIVAVTSIVRKRAKEHATRLLLDGITASMARYRMEYDDFPLDTENTTLNTDGTVVIVMATTEAAVDDFADNGSLFNQMNGIDGIGSQKNWDTPYMKRLDPFLKLQPENLRKQGLTEVVVYDFFSRPIRYCNSDILLRTAVAGAGESEAAKDTARTNMLARVHNETVDLWSMGNSVNTTADDIYNWR